MVEHKFIEERSKMEELKLTNKKDILNDYKRIIESGIPHTLVRSAGSTGRAMYIPLNEVDLKIIMKVGARCWINAGVKPGMRVINTLNSALYAGGILDSLSLYEVGASVYNFSVGNRKELIQIILDLKVEALSCTPSYLDKIEESLKTDYGMYPEQLGLKLILLGGEAGCQNPTFRNNMENKWKAQVIDANYGDASVCSMYASENYLQKNGLIFQGFGYIRPSLLIDGKLQPITKGLQGELVVDTLWEDGLIKRTKYRTGDIIEILSDVNLSGQFRFAVKGRADEMLVIKGLNVYPDTIFQVVEKAKMEFGVDFYAQVRVSKEDPIEKLELWCQTSDIVNSSKVITQEIQQYLAEEIKKATTISCKVIIKESFNLLSTNGKIKKVVRSL